MLTTNRQIIFSLLALMGAALLIYGIFFHFTNIFPEKEDTPVVTRRESAVIREASVGGVRRDESGRIRQTYTGKPPETCHT